MKRCTLRAFIYEMYSVEEVIYNDCEIVKRYTS